MPKVSVIRTKPETVLEDYKKLLDTSEVKKHLPCNEELLLKLNLSWSLYYPACSTEPWQLEGVLKYLKENSYNNVQGVENKTVVTNVMKGVKGNKWGPVMEKYGCPFTRLDTAEWIDYKPKHDTPALDCIFPDRHRIPKMFIGKNVMHLPTLKTHGHTTMTGAMKNAFGGLITERRHHSHKMIHSILVDLLQVQKEIHPHLFAVMDGAVAGNGKGPRTMEPVETNLLLASDDQVAIDAVSARLMGFDPMQIPFIKMAHDKGLGCGDVAQIDMEGDDVTNVNLNFHTGKSPVIFFDQLFRKKMKFIEPLLFHTGLFQLCVFGSAFYHDVFWYNVVGKSRIKSFSKTSWGQLFDKY
ncbi:MAG: DUF362 domain-containing protein [Candidatus Nanoarchaeia archaeon]|nr:DUF362 domain-containing protein [Candidatus Nanoarchaeia archaeon]